TQGSFVATLPDILCSEDLSYLISSAEVNRCQTFTAVDNTAVSLISGKDLCPSQELDLAGA
ncbi:hypothetical protein BHM03_00062591, partial [Ensete ventricosum]